MPEAGRGILVTGASGFLGGNFLSALQAAHPETSVRVLVRDPDASVPVHPRWETVRGDITFPASLDSACSGLHVVVHLASKIIARSLEEYDRVNVEGMRNLVKSCVAAGVRRIITVSNAGVYGFARARGDSEYDPLRVPPTPVSASRLAAERVLLEAHRAGLVEAIILRPLFVYGEGDRFFIPPILRSLRHLPFLLSGGARFSVISAQDLGRILTRLIDVELPSGEFPVFHANDGRPVSLDELLHVLASGLPLVLPRRKVPYPVAAAFIALAGVRGRLFVQNDPSSGSRARSVSLTELRHRLNLVARDHWYSNARLSRLLPKLEFAPFETQFRDCLPYYRRVIDNVGREETDPRLRNADTHQNG